MASSDIYGMAKVVKFCTQVDYIIS